MTFKVKYCKENSKSSPAQQNLRFRLCHKVFDHLGLRTRCEAIFRAVAAEQRVYIEELGFDSDHVHLILYVTITHRIDHLVKSFKGRSGKMLLREFPDIKRRLFWGSGLWGRQVYVDSVGSNKDQMRKYVQGQRYHPSNSAGL